MPGFQPPKGSDRTKMRELAEALMGLGGFTSRGARSFRLGRDAIINRLNTGQGRDPIASVDVGKEKLKSMLLREKLGKKVIEENNLSINEFGVDFILDMLLDLRNRN
jgi:hypothetical protein|tara:strand:+ start:77 stop:397 length:321 start_codon:yes stop_codon:yes gene_type:complete